MKPPSVGLQVTVWEPSCRASSRACADGSARPLLEVLTMAPHVAPFEPELDADVEAGLGETLRERANHLVLVFARV